MSMVIYGMILGVVVLLIDGIFLKNKKFRLHLMPMAVGIYLPVTLAYPILAGGLIRYFVERKRKLEDESKDQGVLLSSGFIAGEAIMGVLVAIYLYFNGSVIDLGLGQGMREAISMLLFTGLAVYLYRVAKKS